MLDISNQEIINKSNHNYDKSNDENNLEKVFERFYSDRPDDSEGSHSGLGLNIVKNIVDSHKGLIKVYNNKDSKGAIVDISLPAS